MKHASPLISAHIAYIRNRRTGARASECVGEEQDSSPTQGRRADADAEDEDEDASGGGPTGPKGPDNLSKKIGEARY